MKKILKNYCLLCFSGLLFLILATALEGYFLNKQTDIRRFKTSLRQKENLADKTLHSFDSNKALINFSENLKKEKKKEDIAYLVYEDKELIYWSNNIIDIPEVYEDSKYNQALIKLNNGYYAVRVYSSQNRKMVALIPIYYKYDFPSNYLKDDFHKDFQLLHQTNLSTDAKEGHFISNKEGEYLLSLIQTDKLTTDTNICIVIVFLYLIGILLLLTYSIIYLRTLKIRKQITFAIILITILIGIRALMLGFKLPYSLYSLRLFAPDLHASSNIFRSLGDYWVNALIIFLCVYIISSIQVNKKYILRENKKIVMVLLGGFMALTIILGLFVFSQIKSLVINSSFPLQVHRGSGIEIYTIWAYGGAALLLSAILIAIRSLVLKFKQAINLKEFYILWLSLLGFSIILALFIDRFTILHFLFLAAIGIIQGGVRYRINKDFKYTLQIASIFLSAFYLTSLISIHSIEKEEQIRSAKAQRIMDSNAPVTKALLETMSNEWNNDKFLLHLFQNPIVNETKIKEYLREQYFNQEWFHYNVQIFICADGDEITSLDTENPALYNDCFASFGKLIQTGSRIGNSCFFELTTYKGITPYVGILSFITEDYGEVRLFIHLDLKPYENEQGYPELLIGKKPEMDFYKRYSFAKYVNKKLRYSNGSFDYYSFFDIFEQKDNPTANYFIDVDGYSHYVYSVTDSYKIIVSEEELSLYKKYIAFPYIFFLLLFIFLTTWALETFPWNSFHYQSFRQQIKIALITMITLVFIIVGGASLFFGYQSNENQYTRDHNAKIQMLRRELFNNLESPKDLDPNFNPELDQKLRDYARILDADINIYDMFGVLLSTSQPEIFSKEILSNRMNYYALIKLNSHRTTEITMIERIGSLEYSSVYVTLWNNKNEPIAYLNVPFFLKYKKFKAEMQDIVIGVLNINLVLIILALIIAFAISQRITSPLVMLQDKFAKIRLGGNNEKIKYSHDDEIKVLVKAYNKMVDELEESTRLLTQSERENAWREMARQVAHEIKNPLTPMKLNIQFLQRKLAHGGENWKEQFEEASGILLKQIDELSSIASAFSNFAKLPTINNENINIVDLLKELVTLYNKGDIRISLITSIENINIFADHDRLKRAFINLITNAIQSIKDPKQGKIDISIEKEKGHVVKISITDNGKGIANETKEKIFIPNFTTKTSGTGLGLALTKDIIAQSNGTINFKSKVGVGTTFIVTLPITESHLCQQVYEESRKR